jgi:hypothetical protein
MHRHVLFGRLRAWNPAERVVTGKMAVMTTINHFQPR